MAIVINDRFFNLMNHPIELSIEQKFGIKSFENQVNRMSPEQAKTMLVTLYEQNMVRETMYSHLLKKDWGLDGFPKV